MPEPPASSLRLDTVTNGDRVVIIVRGDVDAATAPQLLAVVETTGEDTRVIELDLSEVGFVDSTGIGVIAAAIQRLEQVDGILRLSAVPPVVMRLLEITDLLRFVDVASERA